MAEVTIRFRHNPSTGKRDLVISYESEEDMLAHEHERDHRALVESLLGVPLTDDMGDIVVERISKERETQGTPSREEPMPERGKLAERGGR